MGIYQCRVGFYFMFLDILGENRSSSVMSTGISKILKENENQWLNSDVTDFSLSSLLGHLDQSKSNQSLVTISNLSQDVSIIMIVSKRWRPIINIIIDAFAIQKIV